MTTHATLTGPTDMRTGDLIAVDGKPALVVTARSHDGIQLHPKVEPYVQVNTRGTQPLDNVAGQVSGPGGCADRSKTQGRAGADRCRPEDDCVSGPR